MNNSNIKKINVAGLIGYIVSILLIVVSITSMVFIAIGAAGAIVVSKEETKVSVSTNVNIDSNGNILGKLNKFIKLGGVDDLSDLANQEEKNININDKDFSSVDVKQNGNSMTISAKTNDIIFSAKRIFVGLVVTFIWLGAATVMLEMLKRLMKALRKCETPFSENVVKAMTRFGYSLIPAVVLHMITKALWSGLLSSTFEINIDLGSILLVAVIYLLIIVFKHGAFLQRESDETL